MAGFEKKKISRPMPTNLSLEQFSSSPDIIAEEQERRKQKQQQQQHQQQQQRQQQQQYQQQQQQQQQQQHIQILQRKQQDLNQTLEPHRVSISSSTTPASSFVPLTQNTFSYADVLSGRSAVTPKISSPGLLFQRGFTGNRFGIVQASVNTPSSHFFPNVQSSIQPSVTTTSSSTPSLLLPSSNEVLSKTEKKHSVMAKALNLVKKAAFEKDPDAIATIVASLTQSDLALLRLLAFKYERRLHKNDTLSNETITGQQQQFKAKTFSSFGFDKSRIKTTSFKINKRKTTDLLGLKEPINEGFKIFSDAEKARAKAERNALREGKSLEDSQKIGNEASSAVKNRLDKQGKNSNESHPYSILLKQVERQQLIRSWIRAQISSIEGSDKRAISSNTTAAHAAYLRAGGGTKKSIKEIILPATLGSNRAASDDGVTSATASGDQGTINPVYNSKLTRVKKMLLKERISRWLATNSAASTEYEMVKEKKETIEAAVRTAESNARKVARTEAERLLRLKEQARYMKMISLGKVSLTSVRVPVPQPEGTPAGAPQRYKLVSPDPIKHAELLASKVEIGKRRLQKMVIDLLRKGLVESPRIAGEMARIKSEGEFEEKMKAQMSTKIDDTQETKLSNNEAITTARLLASNPLSNSTPIVSITRLIPKGAPIRSLVYVDQDMDATLDAIASEMISTAYFLQSKARAATEDDSGGGGGGVQKRILTGLREVMRGCRSKKVKFVIIAPNIDPGGGDGGLDSQVKDVVDAAREAEIPLIFALSRKKIGQALGSVFRPSIVGFVSVENLNGQHVVAMSLASKLRSSWATRKNSSGDNTSSSNIKSTDLGTSRKSTLNINAEEWVPGGK